MTTMDTHNNNIVPTAQLATDTSYIFTPTQDWFSFHSDSWRNLFPRVDTAAPRVLEIGSWEGRSAVFLLTELCTRGGEIVCIDHFDQMRTEAGRERFSKLSHNLSLTGKKFRIVDEFSVPGLMNILHEEISTADPGFDWVYVDGSHEADDTMLDGELAWRLARKGAVFIFDDYRWDKEPEESIHHPKRGVDAFLMLHHGEYTMLSTPDQYQVILQKETDLRIGFLVKDELCGNLDQAIHIALTVDSKYAMAAAVAMHSAVCHTPGQITFYIVDLGLSKDDIVRIQNSVLIRSDITVSFISLPSPSLSNDLGIAWAKIDMLSILPVERVLYLDADVLVRANLQELWNINLKGATLAAATDIGYPKGHGTIHGTPYFNAGVLLIDLAKVRCGIEELTRLAREMKNSLYKDQDALNVHIDGSWMPLNVRWNAQGLGTYAESTFADRAVIHLEDLDEPAIVHFTGPVHPPLANVLNPYIQPYTAKPWGYAGAPGNPFTEEWWKELEETDWRGWMASQEYRDLCLEQKQKAIDEAIRDLEIKVKENNFA